MLHSVAEYLEVVVEEWMQQQQPLELQPVQRSWSMVEALGGGNSESSPKAVGCANTYVMRSYSIFLKIGLRGGKRVLRS